MAYAIEGIGESGERLLTAIAENPADALQIALGTERRGFSWVTITSASWKYSVAEFTAMNRRLAGLADGGD